MQQNDKPVLIYSTFPTLAAAEAAGARLVEMRLAACVNILPGMRSIYVWQGERRADVEVVMIIKTTAAQADRAIDEGRRGHPYDNPAFLVVPVEGGSAPFLAWIAGQTGTGAT